MFQEQIIKKYGAKQDAAKIDEKYERFRSVFLNPQKQQNIRASKEEQYQEGFLRDLFCDVLGYTIKPDANYNLFTEAKNDVRNKSNSKKADGAICAENDEGDIRAVIELKGTSTRDLDLVAYQAFSYKNFHGGCKYVIVSNFEILRLYVEVQSDYEEFNLFSLSRERFGLLCLLLEPENLMADTPLKMKDETLSKERQITDKFYGAYSTFKRNLFEDIRANNPGFDPLVLFKKTQKLLDRILFVLFCEDRGLLPANSVQNIITRWQTSKEIFPTTCAVPSVPQSAITSPPSLSPKVKVASPPRFPACTLPRKSRSSPRPRAGLPRGRRAW